MTVQFHPERLASRHPEHQELFNSFTRACVLNRNSKLMKANILVVDDDAEIRELLNQVLQRSQLPGARRSRTPPRSRRRTDGSSRTSFCWITSCPTPPAWTCCRSSRRNGRKPKSSCSPAMRPTKWPWKPPSAARFISRKNRSIPESLLNLIKRALEIRSLREAVSTASAIFQCEAMKSVVRTVRRVAPSDVSILITGESGTGKEVIADLIHASSAARRRAAHQNQLRRAAAGIDRERTVRLRQGRLHRRAQRPRRSFPPGGGRHAVAGRIVRNADRHPEQAAARACRKRKSGPSADAPVTRPIAASSPPPIASPRTPSGTASCARICFTASARCRCICRRCASAARTSCRWPTRS